MKAKYNKLTIKIPLITQSNITQIFKETTKKK